MEQALAIYATVAVTVTNRNVINGLKNDEYYDEHTCLLCFISKIILPFKSHGYNVKKSKPKN